MSLGSSLASGGILCLLTTPDLEDTNKARVKTNEEKGQALLERFIQQSNQNHIDERKHVLSDLNRVLAQSGPDDKLTEEEFERSP